MVIKEIKEINNEIKEIEILPIHKDKSDFIERDFVFEDEEDSDKEKDFSIASTMLGEDKQSDDWNGNSLEESILEENFEEDGFDDFGKDGFSYEAMNSNSGGDLYGSASSGVNFYGATDESNSKNMYNGLENGSGGGNIYNTVEDKGSKIGVGYNVSSQSKKKKNVRVDNKSGLESGFSRKKHF